MFWITLLGLVLAKEHDHVQPILIEPHYLSQANKNNNLPIAIDIGPLVSQIASMERIHASSSTIPPLKQSTPTENVETSSAINRSIVLPSKTTAPKNVVIASKVETTTVIDDVDVTVLDSSLDRMDIIGREDEDDGSSASQFTAEMYFNVPAGVDRNAVQAAFLDHGIQGYNPAAQPNPNGLYPASFNSAQRPHTQQQQPPPMPQQPEPQPQHMPPQPAAPPQQPAMLRGPAVPANKPVAVPLAPAHGPGGVGVQSMANAESKGQREVSAVNDDGSDDDSDDKLQTAHGKVTQAATSSAAPAAQTPVGPEMAVKSASTSVAANLPAMAVVPPRNILTSTVVAMSTVTGVAPAATSKVAALAAAPAAPIAPIAPAAPAAAKDVIIADEEEIIEEEEIEDDASDYASDNPLAPKLIPPMVTSTIIASETTPVVKEKPLMLAKAGVTAFKPADLDKFSFPTSEAAVNLAGPAAAAAASSSSLAAAPAASVHTATVHAAQSSHAEQPASSKMPKAKSLTMGNGILSKSHSQNSADSVENSATSNPAASLALLAAVAVFF
ncbi:hypothetical protein LPJ78_003063 [Coemansia sp. RSA 989]|nr:hypothetical protein LPJ78_003063 [Coemansia sp. RSA 989]